MFTKKNVAIPPKIDLILKQAYDNGARKLTRQDVIDLKLYPDYKVRDYGKIAPIYLKQDDYIYVTVYCRHNRKYAAYIFDSMGMKWRYARDFKSLEVLMLLTLIPNSVSMPKKIRQKEWNLIQE